MTDVPVPISFCITDLDPGGAECCLAQLVTGLDRESWQPSVCCLGPPGQLVEAISAAGIEVTCLGARRPTDVFVVPRLSRWLRRRQPRLLQCFLFHGNLAGRVAGKLAGISTIVSGIRVAEREKRWHVRLDRLTRRLVDHVVCVSQAVADFSIREASLNPGTISVIPNGVDCNRFAEARPADLSLFGVPSQSQCVLSVGRLHHQKGFDLLINAIEPIIRQRDDVHLLIAGEGPLRSRLERDVATRNLEKQVHLIGRRDDVASLMRAATMFVLPSRWEGMPNVVLEAMAAGLPVVATPVEGIDELIESGSSGIVLKGFSDSELRQAIELCLSDAEFRHKAPALAQAIARESFTIDNMVRKYDALYRRLIENGND